MGLIDTRLETALETLDTGVLLFAFGGMLFNAAEASLSGVFLTAGAGVLYALLRNRYANLEHFDFAEMQASPPGINLKWLVWLCQWLGSRHLLDGLLGDLVDPEVGGTPAAARRYIRGALWPAIWSRIWGMIQARLWLDRYRR